ncbi:MAG: TatD family hydrolase [Candidatus Latescibacter sp.]|nr:TatD family hydrolase [Candidatus Latescibacter sp.]
MLADTHAHLDFEDFDSDRDQVIERAAEAGVSCIIDPGIDAASSKKAISLAEKYGIVYAAAGIHPNNVAGALPEDMEIIARLAKREKIVAIGETGLDFYRNRTPSDMQVQSFQKHLELAKEMNLPVIIHFRRVEREGIELAGIERFKGLRGVFHCFGGAVDFALELVDMGFCIGFDGPLTYPNSDRIEVAEAVPLERCLIETDSPFLAPQKYRGRRNEPSFAGEVAKKLAEIKNLGVEEVAAVTGRTAGALFGIGG